MNKGGPPKRLHAFKCRKPFINPGRSKERLQNMLEKKQKIEVLEALIKMNEELVPVQLEHIRNLKRRCNKVRAQLRVMSTIDCKERP